MATDAGPLESTGASAALERLPISRWHRKIVLLVGLGAFFDLYDVFLGGVLAPILGTEFGLESTGKAAVVASGFLGMFVGANVLSVLADRLGRRRLLLVNLLAYSVFSLLAAFSPTIEAFLVLRFLTGLGLGAELVLVDTYLSEFMPARVRGRYIAWAYTVGFLGVPVAALLGGRLVAAQQIAGVAGWRWLLVAGALGALLIVVMRRELPESPRWLESRGRFAESERTVREIAAKVGAPQAVDELSARAVEPARGRELSTREVLAVAFTDYRRRTVMLVIFQVLQTVAYYGFASLAPLVLVAKGFTVTQSLAYAALSFAGYPLGSLVSVPLVERFERKYLIIVSALLIAGFGIVFAAAGTPWLIVLAGFLLTTASNVFSNSFHIYQAEIFPTAIRATASGAAYSLSRATSVVLPFVAVPLLATAGPVWVFGGSAVLVVLLCIDVGVLGPLTTGRPLEEVH